ncbi:MAPEG family protein [Thiogranum longum]
MHAPVTAIYVLPLTLLFIGLGMRVALLRLSKRIGIGDDGDRRLAMAIGAHINAAENIPIAVLLLFMLELQGTAVWLLHVLGAVLLVARLIHALGVSRHPFLSFGRLWGMIGTWLPLGLMSGVYLLQGWAGMNPY